MFPLGRAQERRKAKIKKVHLEIAPMGAPDRHVEIMWGGKGDVPDQEDVPPSQRVKAIQLVVRASSYQSLRGGSAFRGDAARRLGLFVSVLAGRPTGVPFRHLDGDCHPWMLQSLWSHNCAVVLSLQCVAGVTWRGWRQKRRW